MPRPIVRFLFIPSFLLLACHSWQDRPASTSSAPPAPPLAKGPPEVALDEAGSRFDLSASHALTHYFRPALILPLAGAGLFKYIADYKNSWLLPTDLAGQRARRLGGSSASLRFAWETTSTATIFLRVWSPSPDAKLSLRLEGRVVKNTQLASGWQVVRLEIPTLSAGEHMLGISSNKKGLGFHSLEIAPGNPSTAEIWPPLTPLGTSPSALAAWPTLRRHLEIPQDAWFVVKTTAGPTKRRFRATLQKEGGKKVVLFDAEQAAGVSVDRRVSLAAFGGSLTTLDLSSRGSEKNDGEWRFPRILLPKTPTINRPKPYQDLILFVADALRADRLPMYANTRVRTPNIAKAAAEIGVTFLSAHAASPSSPPSHAAIQSGMMPRQNGILGDKSKPTEGAPMVSSLCAKANLATAFIGDNGFAMNRLKPLSSWDLFFQPNAAGKGGDCAAVVKGIGDFLDQHKNRRAFVSAVAFEAHTAYLYHPEVTDHYFAGPWDPAIGKKPDGVILSAIVGGKLPFTPARRAQLLGLYDGEVEHLDGCFGALLEGLRSRGLQNSTAIVLLSDHGEGFLEHGGMGHAYGHYIELTHVPLVFFLPGMQAQAISTVVSHIDVVPTILDLLGLPPDPRVQGESLMPLIERKGAGMPRVMPSEYGRSYSLRGQNLHYIVDYAGQESLYDLATDPTEKTDQLSNRPMALRYFRELAGVYLQTRADWKNSTHGTLNHPILPESL